ncbi:hypothetical protein [Phytopseudomonas daroniae]|nr:hypothetical protein [Pseudomonas daroniae]
MAKPVRLQGLIVGSGALESLADAFRLQESGGHFGKIVVEW